MIQILFMALVFGLAVEESPSVDGQAKFVVRRDLPDDLNLPFHENGFTVVSIALANQGPQPVKIDTSKIRVLDPKNKPLAAASSSEITPKMMKSGARVPNLSVGPSNPNVYLPGYGRPIATGATIGQSGGGVLDVGRVERLKAAIEKYQLKSTDMLTGEKAEGYLYLKTDKDPEKLKGTRILLTEQITLTVQ